MKWMAWLIVGLALGALVFMIAKKNSTAIGPTVLPIHSAPRGGRPKPKLQVPPPIR